MSRNITDSTVEWANWARQHVEAMDRFIAGENSLEIFTAKLEALGFCDPELTSEIEFGFGEKAIRASSLQCKVRMQ